MRLVPPNERASRVLIVAALAVCAALSLLTACGIAQPRTKPGPTSRPSFRGITPEEARTRLRELVEVFAVGVEDAGRQIAAEADDVEVKRLAVLFRKRAIEAAREALWLRNPADGFVDLWMILIQFAEYLDSGEGKDVFGRWQPVANQAVQTLRRDYEQYLAKTVPDHYERGRRDVYEFATKNPIRGRFGRLGMRPSAAGSDQKAKWLEWVPSLNPLGAVTSGIDEGAEALHEFGRVASRFTDVVEFLPQQLSWELELFQYDFEASKVVLDTVGGIAKIGDSTEEALKVTRDLPEQVRTELEQALQSVEPKLAEVRGTLAEAREASATLDRTGVTFGQTAQSMESMAAQLDTTLVQFQKVLVLLGSDPEAAGKAVPTVPAGKPEPEGRPFDILDFEKTARAITDMATQLETTLTSFQQIVESDRLSGSIEEVGTSTEETVSSLIWSGVLGAAAVLLIFFGLLLVYRRIT